MNNYKYLYPIGVTFVAALLISNTVASKIVQLGPLSVAGGIILFPITYIFGDILTEVYGYRASRRIIWAGFAAQILMSLVYWVVQIMPSAPFWQNQAAYELILGAVPRIVIASLMAYLVGEFTNSYILSRLKVAMDGKRLWVRTIGSTIAGEGVDSALFALIAFWGILPWPALFTVMISGYVLKVAYEVIATPITYRIVAKLKQLENIDVYDRGINYSPFAIKES